MFSRNIHFTVTELTKLCPEPVTSPSGLQMHRGPPQGAWAGSPGTWKPWEKGSALRPFPGTREMGHSPGTFSVPQPKGLPQTRARQALFASPRLGIPPSQADLPGHQESPKHSPTTTPPQLWDGSLHPTQIGSFWRVGPPVSWETWRGQHTAPGPPLDAQEEGTQQGRGLDQEQVPLLQAPAQPWVHISACCSLWPPGLHPRTFPSCSAPTTPLGLVSGSPTEQKACSAPHVPPGPHARLSRAASGQTGGQW